MKPGALDAIPFVGLTIWYVDTAITRDHRYQANIKLKGSDGWCVQHGETPEDALEACMKSVMRGERVRDPDPPAERARRLIATVASEDDDQPVRQPAERKRREPSRHTSDDEDEANRVNLFTRMSGYTGQERKRR